LQSEFVDHNRAEKNRSLSMENPMYTVSGLSRIVRVVGDLVPIKVRFIFSHDFIAEMALFSIPISVKLCALFPSYAFKISATHFGIHNFRGHPR